MVDPWSSMESTASPSTPSSGPSASIDDSSSSNQDGTNFSSRSPDNVILELQTANFECNTTHKKTENNLASTQSSSKYRNSLSRTVNGTAQAKVQALSLNLEQLSLVDELEDDVEGNGQRKPHFLDEDYQPPPRSNTDFCKIPKPHFLDQSPSPDDPNFLDDDQIDRNVNLPLPPRKPVLAPDVSSKQRERPHSSSQHISRDSSEGRSERGHFRTHLHRGLEQAATLAERDKRTTQLYHGTWPGERDLWPAGQDSVSVKSFSSAGSANAPQGAGASRQTQLGTKVDCVYSLLSLLSLSPDNNADMSDTLLEMSQTVESCIAMRQSGCIPLLVQLVHSKLVRSTKDKAAQALYNMIHAQPDDKAGRREARVWRLLEQVREYCYSLEDHIELKNESKEELKDDMTKHPGQSVAALMKLSFDEEHRHVMCQLGGLQALATLVSLDQETHGSLVEDSQCVTMRKYAGMALTNLTFGDGNNKALLCSFKDFMMALVDQLKSPNDDMRQVTAAVLRNLSWRADTSSKQILREVGAVKGLTLAAMTCHKEATLKSVLSALWNLTAHCSLNKVDLCSVEGALGFLVDMLSFNAPSKTLAIIENSGGILRNVSSHIAVHEDYRQTLRERSCLNVLLQQLKSPSLTVVSNSCGTLWNLSARCPLDQQYLWDHGAVPMLRSLIHSKHKMIAMGSSAALKNLLNSKPGKSHIISLDSTARSMNLPILPTLGARKQKALEQDLDQSLAETCDNIEPAISPTTNNRDEKIIYSATERQLSINLERQKNPLVMTQSSHSSNFLSSSNILLQTSVQKGGHISRSAIAGRSNNVNRSESKDSVTSTHSDSVYERVARSAQIPAHYRDESLNKTGNNIHKSTKPAISKSDRDFVKRYSKEGGFIRYNIDEIPALSINPADIVRNNYSESGYDIDQESCDQPIDYSQKYSETKIDNPVMKSMHKDDQDHQTNLADIPKSKVIPKETAASFGDYQETDLDQPTDYSLRYAEDQSENSSVISDPPVPSVHEDTIKYFCTEGTPYETPINFSTATSMSDLRTIGAGNVPQGHEPPVEVRKAMPNVKVNSEIMTQSDEKDTCSIEDNSRHDNDAVAIGLKEPVRLNGEAPVTYESKFSSGMISPEKPVNYCEEGTPGYFSRFSSLSSLDEGAETVNDPKNLSTMESNERFTPPPSSMGVAGRDKEGLKAVTFASDMQQSVMNASAGIAASVPNYAEETPLMFSRCSSLGSLSGCSVPDQGSVVSEFSRMTSGCISPSELPDSPGQSIPHSPVPPAALTSSMSVRPEEPNELNKVPNFTNSPKKEAFAVDSSHAGLRSVFEDAVSTFQVEHTPIEFSTATSLSSLTIDDEPTQKASAKSLSSQISAMDKCDRKDFLHGVEERCDAATNDSSSVSDDGKSGLGNSDKEDDILAACISAGMQSKIKMRIPTPTSPIKRTSGPIITSSPKVPPKTVHHYSDMQQMSDTCRAYYTEDTPAVLSKAGSQSNLSVISIETSTDIKGDLPTVQSASSNHNYGDARVGDSSDDSSNLSADSGNLLAECIRSGMPKGMQDYDLGERFKTNRKVISATDMPGKIDYMAANYSDRVGNIYSNDVRGETPPPPLPPKAALGVPPPPPPHLHHHHTIFDQVKSSTMAVSNLDRNDSLSSLSIDSLGSTDGELLFQQCVRSGLPKPKQKQDDIHTKTLNKNFKAHSADRAHRNEQAKHSKPSHKSLERGKSDQKTEKPTPRDPEFERLVAIGAYGVRTIDKMTRTEEDLRARALLEEAIYSGMPKRKNKPENSLPQNITTTDTKTLSNVPNRKQTELQTLCDDRLVHTPDGDDFHCKMSQSKNVRAPSAGAGAGHRVSPCADADGTETALHPTATLCSPPQARVTPRSSMARGDEPDPPVMQRNGFNNFQLDTNQASSSENVTSEQIFNVNAGLNPVSPLYSSKTNLSLSTTAKTNGSIDECDMESSSDTKDLNTSFEFKESLFDRSNEYPAQDYGDVLNYSVESEEKTDLNQSNESYANLLNQSGSSAGFDPDYNLAVHDISISDAVANIKSTTSHERVKASIRASKLTAQNDDNFLLTNGKKCLSKPIYNSYGEDTWSDISNTYISIPAMGFTDLVTVSPGTNNMSTSSNILPDLLEESGIHFDIQNGPDLTSKLCDSVLKMDDKTPINENQILISKDPMNFDNFYPPQIDHPEQAIVVNAPESLSTNGSSSKLSSLTTSTVVHAELVQFLDGTNKEDSIIQSNSTNSLDLDHVKPPSRMGSLVSLTQSMSGYWNDQQIIAEREKSPQPLRKTIQKTTRKKSLPVALMVKRALGNSLSNHGSSEHLDFPNSLLDNVKPPSEMDYVLDMENSMLSVASITSEVVDTKDHAVQLLFDLKQPLCSLQTPGNNSLNNLSDLDHVGPPSLFEEINYCTLEYDHHQQTTSADETLVDCTLNALYQCPDSPSPSDYATSSIESTPKKSRNLIKRRLTPKQKRLMTHDRFITYTIANGINKDIEMGSVQDGHGTDRSDSDARSEEYASAVSDSKDVKAKISPKQRRISDRSRYQTQTVNFLALNIPTSSQDVPESSQSGSNFQTFSKRSLKQKRIENADRFRTHTISDSVPVSQDVFPPNTSFVDLTHVHPKLLGNQTPIHSNDTNSAESSNGLHTFSTMTRNTITSDCLEMNLKNIEYSSKHMNPSPEIITEVNDQTGSNSDHNSLDCDQNSGTESADQNHYSDSEQDVPQPKGKPKIVKPTMQLRDESIDSNGSAENEISHPKGIRGRQKTAYISPYRRNISTKKSPAHSLVSKISPSIKAFSPKVNGFVKNNQSVKPVSQPLNKALPRNVLHLKASNPPNNSQSKTIKHNTTSPNQATTSKVLPLERQGTFTMEESTVPYNNLVTLPNESGKSSYKQIIKPTSNTSPSRLPQLKAVKQSLRKTLTSETTTLRQNTVRPNGFIAQGRQSLPIMKNSTSNHSLQSNESAKTIILKATTSAISSNVNCHSATLKAPKEISSRIASLWKKVEQKKSQQTAPDKRVWITNGLHDKATPQRSECSQNGSKLVRSSTFDGPPKSERQVTAPPKQKSSIAIRMSQIPSSRYAGKTTPKVLEKTTVANITRKTLTNNRSLLKKPVNPEIFT